VPQDYPVISVVVCTYNRAPMLTHLIKSLVKQSLRKSAYEIVVVDNASTDDTPEVVRTFQTQSSSPSITLIAEPRQGLGYARNKGFNTAKGQYVAYIDDDCLAPREWVKHIVESFQHVQPEPWSVGGPIFPIYDSPKPKWFKDEFEKTTWGDKARFLFQGESFYGNNMAFQKTLLAKYGSFDPQLDMKGVYLSVGGETDLYDRMWNDAGASCLFYYCPDAFIHHTISPHRITIPYRVKRAFAEGQAWYCSRPPRSIGARVSMLLRTTAALLWHSGRILLRPRPVPSWSSWVVESMGTISFCLGRAAGSWGLLISVRERVSK
jgi:glucosyl-dolichyl phosphate glucuronosyltransferase